MYFFLGISLLFALLLALNFLVSAAATVLWRVIEKPAQNWSAQTRAQVIFSFRIFPLLAAIILVFAFILPSYILFEPHSSDEIVSAKLAILAAISLIGIAAAVYRVFGTWWRTRLFGKKLDATRRTDSYRKSPHSGLPHQSSVSGDRRRWNFSDKDVCRRTSLRFAR